MGNLAKKEENGDFEIDGDQVESVAEEDEQNSHVPGRKMALLVSTALRCYWSVGRDADSDCQILAATQECSKI